MASVIDAFNKLKNKYKDSNKSNLNHTLLELSNPPHVDAVLEAVAILVCDLQKEIEGLKAEFTKLKSKVN